MVAESLLIMVMAEKMTKAAGAPILARVAATTLFGTDAMNVTDRSLVFDATMTRFKWTAWL